MYVALLDVLGYRSAIGRDIQDGTPRFRTRLTQAMRVMEAVNEAEFPYSAISDTVIIARNDDADFVGTCHVLRRVFLSFLRQRLLLRGALTYGIHFQAGRVTYSPALTRAYELEQTLAIHPRIVVDPLTLERVREQGIQLPGGLLCTQNGVAFINVMFGRSWAAVHDAARETFLDQAAEIRGREREFAKHVWLQEYVFSSPRTPPAAERYITRVAHS